VTDQDVAAWIDAQPRQMTYSALAMACLERFGAALAWDADRIRDYWESAHPVLGRSPIDRDGEIVAFLRERMGRVTVDELRAECRTHFAADRVPSRSALHRWILRERARRRTMRAR
jgi:hypothetical protein